MTLGSDRLLKWSPRVWPARIWLQAGGIALALAAAAELAARFLPQGMDWHWVIRPGCLAMLRGESPFEAVPYFGFPPWALLPFLPLALLPEDIGRGIIFIIGLLAFAWALWRLGGRPAAVAAFLISPPVLHSLLNANLDWLPLFGFTLPPVYGLFFISIKPQMGSVVALFWLVQSWRTGGWRRVLSDFTPFGVIFFLSLMVYGFWPSHFHEIQVYSQGWNASLWPGSILVGLVLAVVALRRREIRFAMAASPCLSPYVLLHAWVGALASLSTLSIEMIATVVGLWIIVLLRLLPLGF